jgi:hypothetical protein
MWMRNENNENESDARRPEIAYILQATGDLKFALRLLINKRKEEMDEKE